MVSRNSDEELGLKILAAIFIIVIAIGLAIRISQWLLPFVLMLSIIFLVIWIFAKDYMGNRYPTLLLISIIGFIVSFVLFEIGYGFGNTEFGRMSVNATKILLGK